MWYATEALVHEVQDYELDADICKDRHFPPNRRSPVCAIRDRARNRERLIGEGKTLERGV
jgi:hypothetical protein